jgi:hypothetical protein
VRQKSFSIEDFAAGLDSDEEFENMRHPRTEFHYKNIIPIPNFLTKTFMDLPSTDPYTVAKAFFAQMYEFDSTLLDRPTESNPDATTTEPDLHEENEIEDDLLEKVEFDDLFSKEVSSPEVSPSPKFLSDFIHVIQFCHLCMKGKIPPVIYTLANSQEIQDWHSLISPYKVAPTSIDIQRPLDPAHQSDCDSEVPSPERKISKKDHYFINTMLKLHETMDKNSLKQTLEKEEKEPGFSCLESYRKNLILNASAVPPFDAPAAKQTEFYNSFLSKKKTIQSQRAQFPSLPLG